MTIRTGIRGGAWVCVAAVLGACGGRAVGTAGDRCELVDARFEIRYLATAYAVNGPGRIDATGDRVAYTATGTTGQNAPEDAEVFLVRTGSGEVTQVTYDDTNTQLLDAEGDTLLLAVYGEDWQTPPRLELRRGDGQVVDLGSHAIQWPYPIFGFWLTAPTRMVEGRTATWATDDAVYFHDGETTREIFRGERWVHAPYLSGGRLVFAAWDGADYEIWRWSDGRLEQLTDNDVDDLVPVIANGAVYWRCDRSICREAPGTGARPLDTGTCDEPNADGHRAAWVCDGRARLYDAATDTVRTVSDDARTVVGVRLHGERLVWIETEPEPEPGYGYGLGTLVYSDGVARFDVAAIGLPCMWCDAYWPPVDLSLADGLIAWNYAVPPEGTDPPGYGEPFPGAYARITEDRRCAPESSQP